MVKCSKKQPAASGLPAHSRIHLFVRCGLSAGRDLRLFDYADLEHDLLPTHLRVLSRRFARQDILLVLDGAPNHHRCSNLAVPDNITLLFLPPYAPELDPKENLKAAASAKPNKGDRSNASPTSFAFDQSTPDSA